MNPTSSAHQICYSNTDVQRKKQPTVADLTSSDCDKKKDHYTQQSDRIFRKNICKSNEQILVNDLLAEDDDDDEVLQKGQGQFASEQQRFQKRCEARRKNKLKSKRNFNDQDSVLDLGNDRSQRDDTQEISKVGN